MMKKLCRWILSGAGLYLIAVPASADPTLLVSNTGSGQVLQYTLSGAPLGAIATLPGQLAGLAVRDRTVYVADYTGNLVHPYLDDGTPLATLSPGTGPVGMAFDSNGNLFVSLQSVNAIRKFAPDGADLGLFVSTGLSQPWGLAFDAVGNLYVANRGANNVAKYGSDGTFLGIFASAGLDQPIGLAFDRVGNLYVASFGNSVIRTFSPAGSDLGVFASAGVNRPTEIVFDDDGNLYVANWAGAAVRLFAADGADLGDLVTGLGTPQGIAIMRDVSAGADLRVSVLKGKGVAGAGLMYAAKDTTRNDGEGGAPASETWFYLSTNPVKDGGDTQLIPFIGRSVAALATGAINTGTTLVTIPADTPSGKRFLLACADGPDAIVEPSETDNCKSKTVYVGPDLTVSELTVPVSVTPGQTIAVMDVTSNAGGAPTTAVTTTRFYLSRNKKLDASDVPLGPGRSVAVLAPAASNAGAVDLTVPAGTALGIYYILAKADADDVQLESRETNNVKAMPLTVN